MKPLLQQLENESLLLLYMAGELPDEDRQELEIMLSRDGGLRAQLELLRAAQSASFAALSELDASEPLQAVESGMRGIGRSMRQWWVDQLARPAAAPRPRSMMPVLGWSVGTAVAALMVFCVWWGFKGDGASHYADTQPSPDTSTSNSPIVSVTPPAPAQADVNPPAVTPGDSENAPADLNAVQIVTVDKSSQALADLESSVNDDFVSGAKE